MAVGAWQVFDIFYDSLGAELHSLDGDDTIKMALILSTWTPALTTDVDFAVVDANEHAAANGYTAGGDEVAATWDAATSTLTFDVADNVWTAAGGSIKARYALLWNSSAGASDDLIAYCLLDDTPADVVATDGNTFTVTINASGIFTIAQA